MSLASLPTELLLQITEPLKYRDLLALTRQCRRLYQLVNPLLWRRNANIGLLRAAKIGHVEAVRKFLEIGANPSHKAAGSSKTALALAADGGHVEVVDILLHHLADSRAPTEYDIPAFETAIQSGHDEAVEVFLQHGVKVLAICISAYSLTRCSLSIARRVRKYALPLLSEIPELSQYQLDCVSALLCTAAADGDIEDAKTCAYLHPGAARGNGNSKRLAMSVSDSGSVAMMDFCVSIGLTPGIIGTSSMYIALRSGNLEMARCLHRHGARLCGTGGRFAPAHGACASRRVEVLDFALELGADTLKDYPGPNSTALHHAVDSWQPDPLGRFPKECPSPSIPMLQRLLELGADVNSLSRKNRTPLHFAAGNGWVEGTKFLLDHGAAVDKVDDDGSTPLRRAISAKSSSAEVLKVLLEHGANPDGVVEGKFRYGPLHCAIHEDNFEAIPILLEAGASVTKVSGGGRDQPLHVAVNQLWRGYTEPRLATVKLLLEHGAPLNPENISPPTVRALALKEEECLRTFIECGADIHTTIEGGASLLHHACEARFGFSTRFLLKNGVDPNRRDDDNWTPLHRAIYARQGCGGEDYFYYYHSDEVDGRVGQTTIVRHLLEFGADPNSKGPDDMTPLYLAVSGKAYDTAQLLLTLGGSVNVKTSQGKTPLHAAVKKRFQHLVRLLLDHDADVNVSTNNGKTVLHMVVSTDNDDIVAMILDRNPDVNEKDRRGKTALIMAASRGRTKAVEMLLERNVDIHVRDRTGRSALEWAEKQGHGIIAQMLRNAATLS